MDIVERVEQAFRTAIKAANKEIKESEICDLLCRYLDPLRSELLALHSAGRARKVGW